MKLQLLIDERPTRLYLFILLVMFSTLSVPAQPNNRSDVRPSIPTQAAAREFNGERAHYYRVALAAGEFLQVRIEQKGADVVIRLYDSQRRLLALADAPNGAQGPETLSWVSEAAGEYEVEVIILEGEPARGRYEIRRESGRAATAQDRRRVSVERVFAEAMSALNAKTEAEQALAAPKLREALGGWQELGDAYMIKLISSTLNMVLVDFSPLPMGKTVERELLEGEMHFYIQQMSKGQVMRLEVEEQGVNVLMRLYKETQGESNLYAARNFGKGFSRETLTYVAENDSWLTLVIRSSGRVSSGKGRYKLISSLKAAPTWSDLQKARAEQLLHAGIHYYENVIARKEALDKLTESLAIWEALGEKYWVGYTHNALGVLFWKLTENQRALMSFARAFAIFTEIGEQWSIADVYSNSSQAQVEMGEIQPALDGAIGAEYLFGQFNDIASQAIANNNIGRIFFDAGDYKQGLSYMQKGLSLAKTLSDEDVELVSLASMGGAYVALDQPREAEKVLQQALQLARAKQDTHGLSITLHNLAATYKLMGDQSRARTHLQQALLYERMGGNGLAEANSLYYLMTFLETKNPRLAVFYGKQAVNRYQELRGSIQQADREIQKEFLRATEFAYRHLVDLLITQGRLGEAQQVLNSYKDQQVFDPDPAVAKRPSTLTLTPRESLVALAYRQTSEQVNALSERLNKARAEFENAQLLANLNSTRERGQASPAGAGGIAGGDARPRSPERAQDARTDEAPAAYIARLEAEANAASDKFLDGFRQAEAEFSHPASEKDDAGEVSDKSEMQAALRELDRRTGGRTVALYTFVGMKHYRALLVTPDNIVAKSIPIDQEKLYAKVVEFWNQLHTSDAYDPRPLGRELYGVLLAPFEADLKKAQAATLLWSLDGVLRYIPVAALYDGQQYVVERYRSVIFTRASTERMTSAASPQWMGLGLGASASHTVKLLDEKIVFPALPGVRTELKQIFGTTTTGRSTLKGDVLLDAQFTFERLLAGLKGRPRVVHIASHFTFVPGDEERSFLLLGDGGALTLRQLKMYPDLFRGVELLTLSACNTGALQPGANGREIDTFAELAQRQGAGAVMASLWAVADASTAELMSAFYREREQRSLSKAEALRQAQLALLNGAWGIGAKKAARKPAEVFGMEGGGGTAPRFAKNAAKPYAHPYYWSPFVLIGNGN